MSIRNIVFDLGGVILNCRAEDILPKYFDDKTNEILLREVFRHPDWSTLDRGTGTPDTVMERARPYIPAEVYDECRRIVVDWGYEMPRIEGMDELIGELKSKGFGIYLLSNVASDFHDYCKTIPAIRHFDGCYASADYGFLKPEPEIYTKFLEVFSLKAEECFFIDDTQVNVDGAVKAGFQAYRHNGDIDLLRKKIAEVTGE